MIKNLFNPQFGSIFRTCHNPTYFSRRLCRFSDIYMTSVSCLLNYDLAYTFYPRRTPLQHEAPLWMDQLCTGCMKTPYLEEMSHIRWELCSSQGLLELYILGLANIDNAWGFSFICQHFFLEKKMMYNSLHWAKHSYSSLWPTSPSSLLEDAVALSREHAIQFRHVVQHWQTCN